MKGEKIAIQHLPQNLKSPPARVACAHREMAAAHLTHLSRSTYLPPLVISHWALVILAPTVEHSVAMH
jgi:hypothetical protein